MAASHMQLTVPPGSRATLTVLVRELTGLSHRRARELISAAAVRVGESVETDPVARPTPGSVVSVSMRPRAAARESSSRPLTGPGFRSVYLDRDVIVVNKDSGVLTVPTERGDGESPPLVARVAAALALAGHSTRNLWVVHRIDRETSGLVVFARHQAAFTRLQRQFRARTALREYLAWTEGIPPEPCGRLEHLLVEEERPPHPVRTARRGESGKQAVLRYVVETQRRAPDPAAQLRVRLVTGRRNQIRVQLAAAGCPLIGDRFYGARTRGPGRTALHASRLEFAHPRSARAVAVEAPLPSELIALHRELFGGEVPPTCDQDAFVDSSSETSRTDR
ncbi:MAG: RluA family pseudouridine synthase [Acidobacteriota bacterium]|nr:MAG: RluA family pseudouridine synthase [Acidobacteriota bacterium]